jgi:hypothetical protein
MHAFPNLFMNLMISTRVSIDEELMSGSVFRHPTRESGLDKATCTREQKAGKSRERKLIHNVEVT